MQTKEENLKFIKMKKIILLGFILFVAILNAQERVKIDGVAVVIGENIVLDSDIEKFKLEFEQRAEGKFEISTCESLEEIMTQKLLAHHAVIDSVEVSEAEVNSEVERNIAYFTQQLGTIDKVVEMYGFNDEDDLRKELFNIQKEQLLIRRERASITDEVDVTPEEVRTYFKNLEVDNNLPEFGTEVELAQIVRVMEPSEKEVDRVTAKLLAIRKEVVDDGYSFRLKAIIHSDDPAVSSNGPGAGGKYTITRESGFIKEFKEVAFSLEEGEVSEPFKSGFGYHIILVDKIKGQERDVSHILIQPKITPKEMKDAEDELGEIRNQILKGETSFEEAVKEYSDDKDTRMNRGLILNPQTNDTKFELTLMDPELYNRVSNLKEGEITNPYFEEVRGGDKMFKFILVKSKVDTHIAEFTKDYEKIQMLTLQKKQEETIDNWAAEKIIDTYIKINDDFKDCDLKRNWKKQ